MINGKNALQEWEIFYSTLSKSYQVEEFIDYLISILQEADINLIDICILRLVLDFCIYCHQNSRQFTNATLVRLAELLKSKGDLDHALNLIDMNSKPIWQFEDYRITMESYLIKRPQWLKGKYYHELLYGAHRNN